MIITEPKKLSLPQQVEKNRLDIKDLMAAAILLGSIIEIEDLSHILTTEELALANRPVSFIAYNNNVYAKSWTDDSYIYFLTEVKFAIVGAATRFLYYQIKASINSGQLTKETKSFSTYPAAVLDLALAQKANLSGADFTGNITAQQIEAREANYSFDIPFTYGGEAGLEFTSIFNKLKVINGVMHAILSFKIKNTTENDITIYVVGNGEFGIPEKYASKIFDIDGHNASESSANSVNIAIFPALISSTESQQAQPPAQIPASIWNSVSANAIGIRIQTSNGLKIEANSTIMVSARIALTLL